MTEDYDAWRKKEDEYEKNREELKKYVEDGMDEVTETCELLISISQYPDYMSEELYEMIQKEIKEQLEAFQEQYEWVEHTETITKTFVTLERKY